MVTSKDNVELNLLNKNKTVSIVPSKKTESITIDQPVNHDCFPQSMTNYSDVELNWSDLSYTIPRASPAVYLFKKLITKQIGCRSKCILHPQSGSVGKGQMVIIIGRSGSGKSTLLECLSGAKIRNRSGSVTVTLTSNENETSSSIDSKLISSAAVVNNNRRSRPQVNICYIPQVDHLIPTLTVAETLIYASQLRNLNVSSRSQHKLIAETIMSDLNLTVSRSVLVNRISGGQRKRLSIGLELLGRPDIFLLDEPTSGLDSSNAFHCVQLLRKLTKPNVDSLASSPSSSSHGLAILASMHQPSAKILNQFDKVYLISHDGRLIYFGPPDNMINHFSRFALTCPPYHNPADFAIEIASGDFGRDKIEALENWVTTNSTDNLPDDDQNIDKTEQKDQQQQQEEGGKLSQSIPITDVIADMSASNRTRFSHFWTLLKRTLLTTVRDPSLNSFRLIQHILIGVIVVLLYSDTVGSGSGCLNHITSLENLRSQERLTAQNLALMFFSLMFLTFAAMMPTVMVFPLEMSVFSKERKNGWYSCASFYFAKTLADLPYQLSYTTIYIVLVYFGTGQLLCWWRFSLFLSVGILISLIGQSIGLLFGSLFTKYLQTAIFIAPVSTLPLILISGFFVRYNTIPSFLRPITYTSYLKYAFEALIVTVYGYGRCNMLPDSLTTSEENENGCLVVAQFHEFLRNDLNLTFEEIKVYIPMIAPKERNDSKAKLDYFAKRLDNVNLNLAANQLMETFNSTHSLVMTEYDLDDNSFIISIAALIGFVFFARLLTYFILLHKSERKIR